MSANDDISVRFALPGAQWALSFDGEVVRHLDRHAQRRWYQRESVGQLFTSDLTEPIIRIDLATLLKAKRSSTSSVTFDTDEAMKQRADQFTAGSGRLRCLSRSCGGSLSRGRERRPREERADDQSNSKRVCVRMLHVPNLHGPAISQRLCHAVRKRIPRIPDAPPGGCRTDQ